MTLRAVRHSYPEVVQDGLTRLRAMQRVDRLTVNRERIGNVMIRSIYIMKMRGSKIANTIRVLDISEDGMSVSSLSPYP